MLQLFGYLSGLLSAICYLPYARDILAGKTRPERASWFIWAVLGGIAFFSQMSKGASDSLWLTGVQFFGVSAIFLLALKYGVGGLTKSDVLALLGAGFGLLLWKFTQEAGYALFIVMAIDSIGAALTIRKAYQDPGSETLITWLLAGISGIFAALAVGKLDAILLVYPLYIFCINLGVVVAMQLGKKAGR